MQTRYDAIRISHPKLPLNEVEKIVDTEKDILQEAVKQDRSLPYILSLEDSGRELASETIATSEVRKAVLTGQAVDDLGWKWTSYSEFGFSTKDLTMKLESHPDPLIRQL
jgi:hypothetical protein